jgi:DNA polymerase I-like protein with 3'-5' exonuclease and polymerase domains/RecA-family ATPase
MSIFKHLASRYIIPAITRPEGLRLVFDLETDGLLDTVTRVHCIVVADLDSDDVHEYGPEQIPAALDHLSRADYLIGHNALTFDLKALEKLYGWAPSEHTIVIDTLVAARTILPNIGDLDGEAHARGAKEFGAIAGRNSLEAWGVRLGMAKVGTDIENWSQWTPEVQARCVGDVKLTKAIWHFLQVEGYSQSALALEHRVALVCAEIEAAGVPFDRDAAERLRQRWQAQADALEAQLAQELPTVTNFNSRDQIAELLESYGWCATKRTEKTGRPKLDDDTIEALPELYPSLTGLSDLLILNRRLGQLAHGAKNWMDAAKADERIHGGLIGVGTPHARAKHFDPNLAQVPNPKKGKKFADECRALFRTSDARVLVAADIAGLQDRGLAHYLHMFDGGAYAATFAENADTHWQSAITLALVPVGVTRDKTNKVHVALREGAKRFRYAFLYGVGALKAGVIIAETIRAVAQLDAGVGAALAKQFFAGVAHPNETALRRIGKQALEAFEAGTPGLRQLRQHVESAVQARGWLSGLDGRRIPTRAIYTALNYQITASEAVLCKDWLINVRDELDRRFSLDARLIAWVHDELLVECTPEIAAEVGEIMVKHARAAGKRLGFKCPLDASYTIGKSWAGDIQITEEVAMPTAPTVAAPSRGLAPDPEMFAHAQHFVRKRYESWRHKMTGGSPPHCDDPNIANYKYTNVAWEWDAVSRWWYERVRDPHRDHPDLIFAAIVRTIVNNPDSLEEIGLPKMPPWPAMREKFIHVMSQKGSWRAAYTVYAPPKGGGRGSKARFWAETLDQIWEERAQLRPQVGMTLAALHARIMRYRGFSDFSAAQVIACLRAIEPLVSASDSRTFAAPGPGSVPGLSLLFFRHPNKKFSKITFATTLAAFHTVIVPVLRELGVPEELIHMMNTQNLCCEIFKYLRLILFGQAPKQRYSTGRAKSKPKPPTKTIADLPLLPPPITVVAVAPSIVPEIGAPVLRIYAPVYDGTDADMACEFLTDLFDGSAAPFYLASLANDGDGGEEHILTRDPAAIRAFMNRDRPRRAIFFCASTVQPQATTRSLETVAELCAAYADIDAKDQTVDLAAVETALAHAALPPSEVIETGHGVQAYWHVVPMPATKENIERHGILLKRLADHFAGDRKVAHSAMFLRLPGSHNTKFGEWTPVTSAMRWPVRYRLDELEAWLDRVGAPALTRKPNGKDTGAESSEGKPVNVDARLAVMTYQGVSDSSIHTTQVSVSAALLNRGFPIEEVVEILLYATRRAAEGRAWNWSEEESKIRGMCTSWVRKHPELAESAAASIAIEAAIMPEAAETTVETAATGAPASEYEKMIAGAKAVIKEPVQKAKAAPELEIVTAAALQMMEFQPIDFVVPGLIAEGLTLFAGKPKIGKSWLLLHAAWAIASGGSTLGETVAQGDVFYAALEDNKRRLNRRMRKLFGNTPWPPGLHFACQMNRLAEGGLDQIKRWIKNAACPRLIIIDTLKMVRTPARKDQSYYEADYDSVRELRDLAAEHAIAIVIVHHLRKAESDDPFDTVSGTLGLTGAVDTIMLIWREGGGVTLSAKGRDVEEITKAVMFDKETCTWVVLGNADEVRRSTERETILTALAEAKGEPLSPHQIAAATGMRPVNVRKLMQSMKADGMIKAAKYGKYVLNIG